VFAAGVRSKYSPVNLRHNAVRCGKNSISRLRDGTVESRHPRYNDIQKPRALAERVVVKQGAKTYEFTDSNYKDWDNPLNPAQRSTRAG
jgi:hypothetical protein